MVRTLYSCDHIIKSKCRRETNDNVRGFSNAVYRRYASLAEAEAAFAYALNNCWVRGAGVNGGPVPFSLPTPLRSSVDPDPVNPLQGSEALDWQVVFRGINPGVYCSVCIVYLL